MKKEYYIFKMNLIVLNILSILILIPSVAITYFVSPDLLIDSVELLLNSKSLFLVLICIIGYMILHEIIHALGYIVHGADYKKITFGMEWEKGVFYCLCKQDITRKNILNAVMWPLFYIGFITYIISIIFELPLLLLLSISNICGAAGDIMYFIFLSKMDKEIMFSEMDDGTSFALLSKKDISKSKSLGLQFVKKTNEIPRTDFKRLKISKASYFIMAFCLILLILGFIN